MRCLPFSSGGDRSRKLVSDTNIDNMSVYDMCSVVIVVHDLEIGIFQEAKNLAWDIESQPLNCKLLFFLLHPFG